MPRIEVSKENAANILAIEYLNSAADGILFDIKKNDIEFSKLLKDIQLEICPVSFLAEDSFSASAVEYAGFIKKELHNKPVSGAIFWRNEPADIFKISEAFNGHDNYYPFGLIIEPHTDTESEIANALTKAVDLIEKGVAAGIAPTQIINQISFSLSAGTDFFMEIAKLKSLRFLWQQVMGAYGITGKKQLHIHASSPRWIKEDYQPHGNMIKSTTAAMSAILGGCDSLTLEPEDAGNAMLHRIARNVSAVIREESHLSKVADATAGSFYLESLTGQLSEKAWQKFQSMNA
jgi:methylmalonyl-CoA mutase